MKKLLFIPLLCLLGCSAFHSGGAEYYYYHYDPSTNATQILAVKSVRDVGPIAVDISPGAVKVTAEGLQPGANNVGTAIEGAIETLELIKTGVK